MDGEMEDDKSHKSGTCGASGGSGSEDELMSIASESSITHPPEDSEVAEGDATPDHPTEEKRDLEISCEIPKIQADLGRDVYFCKLPNFLSIASRPFDANAYEEDIGDEEILDDEGKTRIKLKIENTIRWRERFNENNVFVKESNTRFVRWSDGSMSLHLGSEVFEVQKHPMEDDHRHVFIRQGMGLQGQHIFSKKLSFQPLSTESGTHRKMTMSLADRSTRLSGIKVLLNPGKDPEANRQQLIKQEEQKLRASTQRETRQRRAQERLANRGLSAKFLDNEDYESEDDGEGTISIAKIKNKYKPQSHGQCGSGPSGSGSRTRGKGIYQNRFYSSDEERMEVDDPAGDDESDVEPTSGRQKSKARRFVVSDDEDEESQKSSQNQSGQIENGSPFKDEKSVVCGDDLVPDEEVSE